MNSYIMRKFILRHPINASQHESIQSTGHPNACVAWRTSTPIQAYHCCTIFITVVLGMLHVSLWRTAEEHFSAVQIGRRKLSHPMKKKKKSYIDFISCSTCLETCKFSSKMWEYVSAHHRQLPSG